MIKSSCQSWKIEPYLLTYEPFWKKYGFGVNVPFEILNWNRYTKKHCPIFGSIIILCNKKRIAIKKGLFIFTIMNSECTQSNI